MMDWLGNQRLAAFALTLMLCVDCLAATGTIHTFKNSPSGILPLSPLTVDSQGNLYGTTFNGGIPSHPHNNCGQTEGGCGVVYKLAPNGSGGWNYSVIYEFKGSPTDGQDPTDVLAIDSKGNIYGTTIYGGSSFGGTVYELSPATGGSYTEKVLYNFTGSQGGPSTDGFLPNGVILDSAGNLYGTTTYGGTFIHCDCGTVWELSPNAGGGWTEKILYSFGSSFDGANPRSALLLDKSGNLFGTTSGGGTYGTGTVFKLSPSSGGAWTESFLYNFGAQGTGDGCNPNARLISDAAGNLYGTTASCASYGTVFEFSPSGTGYTEKIIHYFLATGSGAYPLAPVVFDSAGNLYGATSQGGQSNWGAVFKLTPNGAGGWVESEIHGFTGNADGGGPNYGVIVGPNGHIYGTTLYGGSASGFSGFGVVFEYNP